MPRASMWFAVAGWVLLGMGLALSRMGSLPGMSLTWGGRGYGLPNALLCFGAGACFCVFAFVYGFYFLGWNERAQVWHFWLSVGLLVLFAAALLMSERTLGNGASRRAGLATMLVFVCTPVLFLLVQGGFLVEAARRIAQGPRLP